MVEELDGASDGSAPSLRFPLGSTVVPGDRLGTIKQNVLPSDGTYVQGGHLYACVAGTLILEGPVVKGKAKKYPVKIEAPGGRQTPVILQVGHVVLGRIARLTIQQAFVDILAGQQQNMVTTTLYDPNMFRLGEGIIRREDVRSGATEQVKLEEMFRPGDLVICRILSLGDRRYVLGTAEPALGVIRAYSSESKQPMIPINWREMECPLTGKRELRKCAKPPKQLLSLISN